MSDTLWPHELQHSGLPCPWPSPRVCSNSCPLSQWWHLTISPSVIPFSFCLWSSPAWGSFPVSQLFSSGGQSIGASASASVLPMNIQGWFPLGFTSFISLLTKGLSRVFSSTTVQKHWSLELSVCNISLVLCSQHLLLILCIWYFRLPDLYLSFEFQIGCMQWPT